LHRNESRRCPEELLENVERLARHVEYDLPRRLHFRHEPDTLAHGLGDE